MSNSFIRVFPNGINTNTGYRIDLSSISKIPIELGIEFFDLSLPQSTERLLVATSGKKEDFNISAELHYDGSNKCFQIDSLGNLSSLSYTTTKQQVNFIRNYIISNKITAVYQLYLDWLDISVYGSLKMSINANGDDFFSIVYLGIQLKVGGNVFGI